MTQTWQVTSPTHTTLLRHGRLHTGTGRPATAMAVSDGRVVFTGTDDEAALYDGADEVVDLAGALVAPAFVDAHVHTVQAGFLLTELDLRPARSLAEALDLLAVHGTAHAAANGDGGVLIGSGWDETDWPEGRPPHADELERAAPGRRVVLSRIDGHSSVVSPQLLDAVPGLASVDGYDPTGRVEREAWHAVNATLASLVGPDQRLTAARRGVEEMASHGVAAFHENAAPHIGPEYELELVRQATDEAGLHATLYWGELADPETARRLGVAGLAGDLNTDGAFGSRTAALRADYADSAGLCGHVYLTPEQVADHVVACTRAGIQAGFHCIGDAAMDAIGAGFDLAEARVGLDALVAARHRLEHVEMPSATTIATLARCGVVASVQPVFDALWGGPDRMYAERLGERWSVTNPFRAMADASVRLAFGSDSPVTPIRPWQAVRAAIHHRTAHERLGARTAFAAHTRGGWYAARIDDAGHLRPGARATYAVWETPGGLAGTAGTILPDLAPDAEEPRLIRTVVAGRTVHDREVDR